MPWIQPAEEHPDRFHGTGPFDIPSGQPLVKKEKPNYTDVFSTVITKIAAKDDRVVAITAAMADGTGLKRFRAEYPARFFDVGIAEGHAVHVCSRTGSSRNASGVCSVLFFPAARI